MIRCGIACTRNAAALPSSERSRTIPIRAGCCKRHPAFVFQGWAGFMLSDQRVGPNRRCPRATVAVPLPEPSSDRTYGGPDSKRTMRGFVFVSGKPSAECPYGVGRYSSVWSVSVRVIQKSQVRFCPVTVIE